MPKNPNSNPNTGNQGFASMDPDKQREIASQGGKASSGSFEKGSQRAKEAGRKGGKASGNTDQNNRDDDY
ncbi:hypothetical protein BDF20DRAFT_847705 [Mycotypha africana]|uniref:uncharacterized protein n=1 Tax=Mycotypha africana TaxID=64632 RepID=UPI0023014835|nr:uncharacterized protein BDF20DRAFT_847705 [Mycotypha africana]KAI8992003.1 hypothetical protein BDF20DRAFT_847705 [Mycotypha africana]